MTKKQQIIFSLLFALNISYNLSAKILIFTYAHNQPDFIEIHHKTLQKFLMDDYELVVFNDASTQEMCHQIEATCASCKIPCVRIPQEIHDLPYLERPPSGQFSGYQRPSVRHCNAIQYSLNNFGFKHDDILVILDGDLFLTKKFSIKDYLKNYDIAAFMRPCCDIIGTSCTVNHRRKKGIKYLWVGLLCLNIPHLPNIESFNVNCGFVNEITVDSGGHTYHYLKNNPHVRVRQIKRHRLRDLICNHCKKNKSSTCHHNTAALKKMNFDDTTIELAQTIPVTQRTGGNVEFFLDDYFVHYGGVTNYNNLSKDFLDKKNQEFNQFIMEIL
jgi:hypothetical protein